MVLSSDVMKRRCMVLVLNGAFRDGRADGAIEKMWVRRFYDPD